jgi:hypothetical protein
VVPFSEETLNGWWDKRVAVEVVMSGNAGGDVKYVTL